MKLLIVDDEELTRNGLINLIPWDHLGISHILSAKDGAAALELFYREQPQIVLCDLRMPRMDGVTLAENIKSHSPETSIIFMSGYSDKEYLKAAIRLNAISYVEKPIHSDEIESAIHDAILRYKEKTQLNENKLTNRLALQAELAYLLTVNNDSNRARISQLSAELFISSPEELCFISYLARPITDKSIIETVWQSILLKIADQLHIHGYSVISAPRGDYYVFHIYGSILPSPQLLDEFDLLISDEFCRNGSFYLSRGDCVSSALQVHHSYASAAFLLQSCYYFSQGQILTPDQADNPSDHQTIERFFAATSPVLTYNALLKSGNETDMTEFLDKLYHLFFHNCSALSDEAKDLYYQLFRALSSDPASDFDFTPFRSLMSYIGQYPEYTMLHQDLMQQTLKLMRYRSTNNEQKDTIALIKGYILAHYMDSSLSVKDISEHVYLSASYVCTIFKSETGHTLNQYITEFRIKQAKELLLDSANKITDISTAVGYSDGNYFAKSFRKIVGMSPSDYRERYGQNAHLQK